MCLAFSTLGVLSISLLWTFVSWFQSGHLFSFLCGVCGIGQDGEAESQANSEFNLLKNCFKIFDEFKHDSTVRLWKGGVHYCLYFFFKNFFIFICGCVRSSLQHAGLVAWWHVGFQFPNQGLNQCPLHWKATVNHWNARQVPVFISSSKPQCPSPKNIKFQPKTSQTSVFIFTSLKNKCVSTAIVSWDLKIITPSPG